MPKIKKSPPPGIMNHLIKRYREDRISSADFLELKHWMESDPDVPNGKWYKRFKTGTLAGKGEMLLTFLSSGMAVDGKRSPVTGAGSATQSTLPPSANEPSPSPTTVVLWR